MTAGNLKIAQIWPYKAARSPICNVNMTIADILDLCDSQFTTGVADSTKFVLLSQSLLLRIGLSKMKIRNYFSKGIAKWQFYFLHVVENLS